MSFGKRVRTGPSSPANAADPVDPANGSAPAIAAGHGPGATRPGAPKPDAAGNGAVHGIGALDDGSVHGTGALDDGSVHGTVAVRRADTLRAGRGASRTGPTARRRFLGAGLVAATALVAALLWASDASAIDDEPDLVPFLGAYALGCTWDNGCTDGHHGASRPALDFPMPEGVPVVAAARGEVAIYEDDCAGKYIELWHAGARKWSRYLHLSGWAVHDGDVVSRGQVIGYSGNTGSTCSTGPHLHYAEIDPTRHRVDPGRMVGQSNGATLSYPNALGVTGWNQMEAFFGPIVRNDYVIGNPSPTTLATTTTLAPQPATTNPPTTNPPTTSSMPTPTTAGPTPTALPEGTLFRAPDAPNVFVYAGGTPWWVPEAAQVDPFGGWSRVQVLGPSLDDLMTALPWRPLQHRAFTELGDGTMYWCSGGSPWPLSTMAELAALQSATGAQGWSRLPARAGRDQWACGGTGPGTLFQIRGTTGYLVWTTTGWRSFANLPAVAAAGYATSRVNLLPAT